jgi:esterase
MTTTVPANSRFVVRDSVRLHHLDWGNEGQHPVVLVHGSRLHAHVWNHFSRRFKDRFHIVAVDQRGHGDSGWGPREGYALEELYQDLCAVIDARGLKRFTLIGHSLGGRVSMLYASRHHQELERLVLVDITPGRPSNAAAADFSRITETPGPGEFDSEQAAIEYLGKLLSRAPAEMIEESVRHGMRRTNNDRYTWKYDPELVTRRVATTVDLWSLMQSVPTQTLLLYGSHSNVVTPELAARLGETMPQCVVERIENAGHALFTDQPEAFAASVGRFLGA